MHARGLAPALDQSNPQRDDGKFPIGANDKQNKSTKTENLTIHVKVQSNHWCVQDIGKLNLPLKQTLVIPVTSNYHLTLT